MAMSGGEEKIRNSGEKKTYGAKEENMQASKQEVPPYKIRKRMREEGEQDEERLTRLRTKEVAGRPALKFNFN